MQSCKEIRRIFINSFVSIYVTQLTNIQIEYLNVCKNFLMLIIIIDCREYS